MFGTNKKRFRTLFLPYILWNLNFVLWYVVLTYIPGVDKFNNNNEMLSEMFSQPVINILKDLFVNPVAFQLWFLRDLIFMLILTPLLWWLAKKNWILSLVLSIASVSVYPWLIYFWIGIIISTNGWDIQNYPKNIILIVSTCILWIGYAIWKVLGLTQMLYIDTIFNLIGLYVVWSIYDIFSKGNCVSNKGIWKFLCGFSFFVYCFHEPAFNIIKKLTLHFFGISEPTLIILYFINPWIMVFMAVLIARFLAHYTPSVYKILTGGR